MSVTTIDLFVDKVTSNISHQLESIISYLHPFNKNGIVVVFNNEIRSITDGIVEVYRYPLNDLTIHCLRRSELIELSMPSIRGKLHPLLVYQLKYQGIVHYGKDIRNEITTPAQPEIMLENLIESIKYMRGRTMTSGILHQLLLKRYQALISDLQQQLQLLMVVALLTKNIWQVSLTTLVEQFQLNFADTQLNRTIDSFIEIAEIAEQAESSDEPNLRNNTFTSVWLFERFLTQLEDYLKCH